MPLHLNAFHDELDGCQYACVCYCADVIADYVPNATQLMPVCRHSCTLVFTLALTLQFPRIIC